MAETSKFWTTNGTGDGPSGGYTQQQFYDFLRAVFVKDTEASDGVLKNYLNGLVVTSPSATNIDIASGGAIVYGFFYENSATLNLSFAAPAATTGGRAILEVDWTAQTVRGKVILNSSGVTTPPTLTQSAGSIWQISLYSFQTDNAGNVSGLTDERGFAAYGTEVTTEMLEDDSVTNAKIATDAVNSDSIAADAVGASEIAAGAVGASEINSAIAGNGLAGGSGTALSVNVDGSTIEINADTLRVKAGGLTSSHLAADSVGASQIQANAVGSSELANDAVDTNAIQSSAVTAAKIANRTRYYEIPMGPNVPDDVDPAAAGQYGFELATGKIQRILGGFRVPADYASGGAIKVVGYITTSLNNAVCTITARYAAVGQALTTHADSNSLFSVAATNSILTTIESLTLTNVAAGDYCWVEFKRNGTDAGDNTLGMMYIQSVTFEYTADA